MVSPNPPLRIVTATTSTFRAEDDSDPRFYLFATFVSGVLRFEVVAKRSTGERGAVSGKQFFSAMMAHFGAKVTVIESDWSLASGLTTNIDSLNRATAAGLSVEDAAVLTWTGLRASEHGFENVTILQALPPGAQGVYDSVRVLFHR